MNTFLSIISLSLITLLLPFVAQGQGPSCAPPCNPRPPDCDPSHEFLPCTCSTRISWVGCTMQTCQNADESSKDWYACYCNSTSTYSGRCYSTGCTLPGFNGNYTNYMSAYSGNSPYSSTCQNPQCLGQPQNCTSNSMPDKTPCSCTPSAFPKRCQMQPCGKGENTFDMYQCISTPAAGRPSWNDMCTNGNPWSASTSLSSHTNLKNNP